MASTIINVRSPYWFNVSVEPIPLDPPYTTTWDITIWAGNSATVPLSQYRFVTENTTLANSSIEVGELIKDYIEPLPSTITNSAVWVQFDMSMVDGSGASATTLTNTFLAFNGYGYHYEGAEPSFRSALMQTATTIYVPTLSRVTIPVLVEDAVSVIFKSGATTKSTVAITDTTISGSKVGYAVHDQTASGAIDNIEITTAAASILLTVVNVDECKYTPIKIHFINKYGAIEEFFFYKKSMLNETYSKQYYDANILTVGNPAANTYSLESHGKTIMRVNGMNKLTVNTGFISESAVETIRQIMLSEKVWIDTANGFETVNIEDAGFVTKTIINDKLINYTLNLEYSNPSINTVR